MLMEPKRPPLVAGVNAIIELNGRGVLVRNWSVVHLGARRYRATACRQNQGTRKFEREFLVLLAAATSGP